jgi:hypothetical protein
MKKSVAAESPDAYVAELRGWQKALVERLRRSTRSSGALDEVIKWRHLVYFSDGPVLLIRAEDERVLFGFWRGQRLRDIEERLKPGGRYEMATISLLKGDTISPTQVTRLVKAAIALNKRLGDPTMAAR